MAPDKIMQDERQELAWSKNTFSPLETAAIVAPAVVTLITYLLTYDTNGGKFDFVRYFPAFVYLLVTGYFGLRGIKEPEFDTLTEYFAVASFGTMVSAFVPEITNMLNNF